MKVFLFFLSFLILTIFFGGCATYTITTDSIKETIGIGGNSRSSLTIKNNANINVVIDFDGGTYLIPPRLKTVITVKNGLFNSSNSQSISFSIAVTPADDSIKLSSPVRNWYTSSWSSRSSEIWVVEQSYGQLYFR